VEVRAAFFFRTGFPVNCMSFYVSRFNKFMKIMAPVLCIDFMGLNCHKIIDAPILQASVFFRHVGPYSSIVCLDSQASCASGSQASCGVEMRRPNNSCPNAIGFQWRRELQGRRVLALHHTAPHFECMCERMCSDTQSTCGSILLHMFETMLWQALIFDYTVPKRMCFLWRRELIKHRRSPQHTLKN
jgi:hypothetical protein